MDSSKEEALAIDNTSMSSQEKTINANDIAFKIVNRDKADNLNSYKSLDNISALKQVSIIQETSNPTDTNLDLKRGLSERLFTNYYEQNFASTISCQNKEIIMMGSTNYLGLSHHPKVTAAAIQAINDNGIGGLGSRFTNGSLRCHEALDNAIVEFLDKEDCVFYNSGYMANLGAFTAFGRDALVFSDKENHLSIYDACQLSSNKYYRFQHNNLEHLNSLLEKYKTHPNKWVVIVGTFGATGENIRLEEIVKLAKSYNAKIYLDDAHAVGIYGPNKRGLADLHGVYEQIDLIMTSFQMAFGNIGAVIAGTKELIEKIRYMSRLYIFTYTLPPDRVLALLAALEIVRSEEGTALIKNLVANAKTLREGARKIGLHVVSDDGHIVSLRIGDEQLTAQIALELLENGVWGQVYIHPSVPLGKAIIRLTCIALHTPEHLDKTLLVLSQLAEKYPILKSN